MKNKISFYQIVNSFIRLLAAAIIFVLFLHSIFSTSFIGWIENEDGSLCKRTLNITDSPWKHFVVFVVFILCLWIIFHSYRKLKVNGKTRKIDSKWILLGFSLLTCALGICWIAVTQLKPGNDPAKVYAIAMQWRNGDFSAFEKGEYLFNYPFQSGIILFYYLMSYLVGMNNYVGLQIINAVALAVIYYFIAKLAQKFWKEDKAVPVMAYLAVLCWVPMLYYVTYLYGIIPGMAFAMAAVYLVMQYLESGRIRYGIGAAICIGIAIVLKSNCLIYLVAMSCFLVYDAIDSFGRKGKENENEWKPRRWLCSLLCVAMMVLSYVGCTKAYQKTVENISGYELSDGAAMVSWVFMGLQDSEDATGPGEYNGYIIDIFKRYHYDSELVKEATITDIKKVIKRMSENPLDDGVTFFAKKMAFQWNDPTFVAMERTEGRESAKAIPGFARSLIDGQAKVTLSVILNYVQTLIWIGVLLYLFIRWKSRNLYELMGIVIFLGGYLFHFVWESGASYTIPYFLVLIPYAVKGYLDLTREIEDTALAVKNGTMQWKRRKIVTIIMGLTLTVLFVGLLQTTNLFHKTIALDDGTEAMNQFYHQEATNVGEEGY